MVIIAKYASTCLICRQKIYAGTGVNWVRGSRVWHVECPPTPATSPAPTPVRPIEDEADALLIEFENQIQAERERDHCGVCGTFLVDRADSSKYACVRCTAPRRPYPTSRQGYRPSR
jgi:hypothetical protein